jgi:hypothetical protein
MKVMCIQQSKLEPKVRLMQESKMIWIVRSHKSFRKRWILLAKEVKALCRTLLVENVIPSSVEVLGQTRFFECRSCSSRIFESRSRLPEIAKQAFLGTVLRIFLMVINILFCVKLNRLAIRIKVHVINWLSPEWMREQSGLFSFGCVRTCNPKQWNRFWIKPKGQHKDKRQCSFMSNQWTMEDKQSREQQDTERN